LRTVLIENKFRNFQKSQLKENMYVKSNPIQTEKKHIVLTKTAEEYNKKFEKIMEIKSVNAE